MKLIYLIYFCPILTTLVAYPVDYNETSIAITRDALNDLRSLISSYNFSTLLEAYTDKTSSIVKQTYEATDSKYNNFIDLLSEVEEIAENVNADVTECLKKYPVTPEKYYENYSDDCGNPASAFGVNLKAVADEKNWGVFARKYEALMHSFMGCTHSADPAPYICEGVVAATLQEVNRIVPEIKPHPLLIKEELDRQILVLSKCSSEYLSVLSSRLQVSLTNIKTCILSAINTV